MKQVGQGAFRVAERGALAFGAGVVAAIKVAGDFEGQLNTINTIAKLNDTQLRTLGEGVRQTFRDTGVPLDELTSAYYDLLSAGIKVEDAQSVLNTSVRLGIGGLATTKEAVDLLTTAINSYGLDAKGAAGASDIFAAAVRDGKLTISQLSGSFADVAPLAAQAGVKLEELGAAYATLTARGVPAAEVGTQINRGIIELLKPGPKLIEVMKKLGLTNFETSIKNKGLVQTLQDVRDEAQRLNIPFQDLFGRLEGYKFALATTGPNNQKFIAELEAMGTAAGETNAQFEERAQGLNFQLGRLKAAAQDAGITIGNALIPKLLPLVEELNQFIQDHQADIATFGQKLADGLASFADRLKTVDFTGVIGGLKLLGDGASKVIDAFLKLPPNVQGIIIAGLAANKLSGGLLGSGAANIAGGILSIVFSRGSSAVNPLYTWQVNSAGGGSGPPSIIPTLPQIAAAAVVAGGTLFSAGSNEGLQAQIIDAMNALGGTHPKGTKLNDLLSGTGGVTLTALSAIAHDRNLRAQLDPAILAQLDAITNQFSTSLRSMDADAQRQTGMWQTLRGNEAWSRRYTELAEHLAPITAEGARLTRLAYDQDALNGIAAARAAKEEQDAQSTAAALTLDQLRGQTTQLRELPDRFALANAIRQEAANQKAADTLDQLRQQTTSLNQIAAKSTTFNFTIPVSTSVSISDVQRKIISQQFAIGHGFLASSI